MIYKFDILFSNSLKEGGLKVVTYSSLLEEPEAFGRGESLAGAVGSLSMVLEGIEQGYSINALVQKYYGQLIGRSNAATFGKQFPVRFFIAHANDAASLMIEVKDDGNQYTPNHKSLTLQGQNTYSLHDADTCVCLVSQQGSCTVTDDSGVQIRLNPGLLALCAASARQLIIESDKTKLIWLQ